MKVKVAELSGAQLDIAVAMAEGLRQAKIHNIMGQKICFAEWATGEFPVAAYSPTQSWFIAGPIIARERIEFILIDDEQPDFIAYVGAVWEYGHAEEWKGKGQGATHLIAAMRAYVTSKFGAEIELPAGDK